MKKILFLIPNTNFSFITSSKMVIITTSAIKSGSQKLDEFVASKKQRLLHR